MGFPTFKWLVPHSKEKHPLTMAHKEVNDWIPFTSLALSYTCPSFVHSLYPTLSLELPHAVLGLLPVPTLQNAFSPHAKITNSPLFRFCKIYPQFWGLLWIVYLKLQSSLSVPNIPDIFYPVILLSSFHHLANHKICASVIFITVYNMSSMKEEIFVYFSLFFHKLL